MFHYHQYIFESAKKMADVWRDPSATPEQTEAAKKQLIRAMELWEENASLQHFLSNTSNA